MTSPIQFIGEKCFADASGSRFDGDEFHGCLASVFLYSY
jgi:hypothetical protein